MKNIERQDAFKLVMEASTISHKERLKLQMQRLRELVEYARQNSPYFKSLYKDLPQNYSLSDLPPTKKGILLDNYNDWVTDREINKENVLDYLDRDPADSSLLLGKYTALKTSGSTGHPLPMVRDSYHNMIHGALMGLRLMKGVDFKIFDPATSKKATILHTSPNASSYSGFLREVNANKEFAHNYLAISVLESIDQAVYKLNGFQPDILTGYASSLLMLALEKEKGNLDINPKLIGNSAELLTDEAFKRISKAFGCPVVNNYCMTEGGEVAMANGSPELFINEDWVIVEPVDKDMNPITNPDEYSDGVLITDLSNFVQPIIRYYVNDRVKLYPPKDEISLPVLKIDGRVADTFTLCGKQFSMVNIITKAEVWPGLLKYQIVQTDPDSMEVRGICAPGFDPEEVLKSLASKLEEYFHGYGCENAKFNFSLQPLLYNERGGKIPLYKNNSTQTSAG
ncbi:MAG: phenylacetate--CoA ligase family protein [Muribaculaceae bacterium]|nr:phenylacetate--CoA ligase family protein [Muribaculaceae bacterium]